MTWDQLNTELASLAEVFRSLPQTERTAEALYRYQAAVESAWRSNRTIELKNIPVPPPRDKAMFPRGCEIHEAELSLRLVAAPGAPFEALDAFCELQVRVGGMVEFEDCLVDLEDHWRVDTHNFAGTPVEPHPLIHFQRGGHAQEAFTAGRGFIPSEALPRRQNDPWKALFQPPGPRVPFLPFCPALAFDYIIGQHDGTILGALRGVPEYRNIVKEAQQRLWVPFFDSLSRPEVQRRWLGGLAVQ